MLVEDEEEEGNAEEKEEFHLTKEGNDGVEWNGREIGFVGLGEGEQRRRESKIPSFLFSLLCYTMQWEWNGMECFI